MSHKSIIMDFVLWSLFFHLLACHKVFKLNTFFFFDPVSETPCNETNYWTPFDQSTTCYRFVSVTSLDSPEKEKIKIMLDHNIARSNYTNYVSTLKKKTAKWKRYNGTIDIIDEKTIYKLLKYQNEPDLKTPSKPPYKIGHFCSNSDYTINGKKTNQKGYWTKTVQSVNLIYAIDHNCRNFITSTSTVLGIRPVLEIEKSLLLADSGVIDITKIIKKGTKIQLKHEKTKYGGIIYKQLQGFTVTKDKLAFISGNNQNREKSVLYTYKLNDLKKIHKKEYSTFGHGNGMTYNSKLNKLLIIGPNEYQKVYLLNEENLKKEEEYSYLKYPGYTAIGYDEDHDLYVGHYGKKIFLADTKKMSKLYEFGITIFEAGQDLEYYNGYIFDCTTDGGANFIYQSYSFYNYLDNIIYVYDVKLDKNKNPTKNFGRLTARLIMSGLGELESISFRDGYVYLGFNFKGFYTFYKFKYKSLAKEVKIIS